VVRFADFPENLTTSATTHCWSKSNLEIFCRKMESVMCWKKCRLCMKQTEMMC